MTVSVLFRLIIVCKLVGAEALKRTARGKTIVGNNKVVIGNSKSLKLIAIRLFDGITVTVGELGGDFG